jgi:hypothetical protein
MHVFRHVSKAAGTTMRFIFDKQVAMGDWEFLPLCHYGFREGDWRTTVERFREAAVDPERVATGRGPRVIVEIRNEWGASEAFERVVLPDLDALREYTSAVGCEITSSMLFRDPPAQYRSFYEYYIEKLRDGKDLPRGDGPESWGADFEEWAAEIPDLQLRELLGDRCTPKLREAPFETKRPDDARGPDARPERVGAKPLPESCKISLGDRARFEKIVAAVDVVGVADRFDAFWLALADRVGFQHLEYVLSNAAKKKKDAADARRGGGGFEPGTGGVWRGGVGADVGERPVGVRTRQGRGGAARGGGESEEDRGGSEGEGDERRRRLGFRGRFRRAGRVVRRFLGREAGRAQDRGRATPELAVHVRRGGGGEGAAGGAEGGVGKTRLLRRRARLQGLRHGVRRARGQDGRTVPVRPGVLVRLGR